MKKIFCGSFEVQGNTLDKLDGAAGGFVYCFSADKDMYTATQNMMNALIEDEYEIMEVEYIKIVNEEFLEELEEKDRKDFYTLGEKAIKNNDVVYSDFYTYEVTHLI